MTLEETIRQAMNAVCVADQALAGSSDGRTLSTIVKELLG